MTGDSAMGADSGGGAPEPEDSGDIGGEEAPPPYCRSLDPAWRDAFVEDIDRELAELIAREGLEGDPTVYVDSDGLCRRRELPSPTDPPALLGRRLFFSFDLSGDRDTACASCHHPLLGGGDALPLSIGPAEDPTAMGSDRAAGITDVAELKVPRNAPTTFQSGLWDRGMFWDARVEALLPEPGLNGAVGGITTPEAPSRAEADPAAWPNLPAAQAAFPVTAEHEMAGSWALLYPEPGELRAALSGRLAEDDEWVEAFAELCGEEGLPDSFVRACDLPEGEERGAALATFDHAVWVIGEYERSQVFVDSPWRAYVLGDVQALSPGAKTGALLFLREVEEGGQGCAGCHQGDTFTDEDFHAVATPQIGPGRSEGEDLGRAELTGDADLFRFRTPSLLNVATTAPYGHAGAYSSLAKMIGHYDNPNGRILEYFGDGNKSDLNLRPWCQMDEFASIPECASLYTAAQTHRGRVSDHLDPKLEGIKTLENNATAYLQAFLDSLTDPATRSAEALAPWIEPDSPLRVTGSSSPWGQSCDTMIERAADMNLHNKGLRWVATGEIVDGGDVNTGEVLYDTFGVHYWELFDTAFMANTGLDQDDKQLAVAVTEVLSAGQRSLLTSAYASMTARGNHPRILALRQEVFARMGERRLGGALDEEELSALIAEAAALEAEDLATMVRTYRDMAALEGEDARAAELLRLAALQAGDLSSLPEGVYVPGATRLEQSEEVQREIRAVTREGTIDWDAYAAGYATWSTGWTCRQTFMSRQLDDDRRSNYYGFSLWAAGYLFDLNTGKVGSGDFEQQLSDYLAGRDAALGIDLLFADTLEQTIALRADYDLGRAALVEALQAAATATDEAAAESAIAEANAQVARADAAMLLAELSYFGALADGEAAAGSTRLAELVACIEDPDTQAMKGAGGFEALGGGTCEPD